MHGKAIPWGRNFLGTPPQGRADYAFFQHILGSHPPEDRPRCAILFPHGVLFRNEESEMRRELVESDLLECVARPRSKTSSTTRRWRHVWSICRTVISHLKRRERKILFIDAVREKSLARTGSQLLLGVSTKQTYLEGVPRPSSTNPASAKVVYRTMRCSPSTATSPYPRYVQPRRKVAKTAFRW